MVSLTVIVVGVFVSIIAFDIIKFTKATRKFLDGVNKESAELYEKINKFLETVFNLSFISKFFNKKNKIKK